MQRRNELTEAVSAPLLRPIGIESWTTNGLKMLKNHKALQEVVSGLIENDEDCKEYDNIPDLR